MQLTSPVFGRNGTIPIRYTGEGNDVSPPLEWSYIPEGTRSFALLCDDPDAPVRMEKEHPFAQWIVYNIPVRVSSLPEGLPRREILLLPLLCTQGRNSAGKIGYHGPMPAAGSGPHHYHFKLFALSTAIPFAAGMRREAFLLALQGHVLETAELVGTYERSGQLHRHTG